MKCKECSKEINEKAYFCPVCGKLVKEDLFKNKEFVSEFETKIKTILENLKKKEHKEISWNTTVDKYTKVMEKMQYVLSLPEFESANTKNILRRLEIFRERCEKPEFHIAFVGTIKAGKSTLINALLGKNYASTSVTPETAVLTKFRHCDKENFVRVKFYTKEEWELLWNSISNNADVFLQEYKTLNADAKKAEWIGHDEQYISVSEDGLEAEIEKWTSSKKAEHYFVKEVEIGLMNFKMPSEVVFVDTPGLDDAVKYRSDVTRQYIDRANAVFACVKSDSLTGPELNTLYRIFSNTSYNPEKVYIIGTQWDTLNNPQKDWEKQKEEWVKYLSGKEAFGNKDLAKRNITYAAAYINNLARDYESLDEDESFTIQSIAFKFRIRPAELESSLQDLIEMSNLSEIDRHIQQDLVVKYKEYLYKDIEEAYMDIKLDIKKLFEEVAENEEAIINTSSKDIESIRKDFEKAKSELDEVQKYRQQLTNTLKIVSDDTKKRIGELTKQLKELV